ncbi:hypothetical protein BC628DRAFT_36187 [Trametes gibbosa]|nr:hypothetical protein BC628DRAFT_36187 [Trametes gibbosa]
MPARRRSDRRGFCWAHLSMRVSFYMDNLYSDYTLIIVVRVLVCATAAVRPRFFFPPSLRWTCISYPTPHTLPAPYNLAPLFLPRIIPRFVCIPGRMLEHDCVTTTTGSEPSSAAAPSIAIDARMNIVAIGARGAVHPRRLSIAMLDGRWAMDDGRGA